MKTSYWGLVNKVIDNADVLLLLLDARMIEETRNIEIEDKVRMRNKPLIYVITKSDLVDTNKEIEKYKKILVPCVFISAKSFLGTSILRERILIEGKKAYKDKEIFKVGVLGYPNVGKSSLINAVKGRHSASTSSMSGHTKAVQLIKADNCIFFLDTPGVIPYKEKDRIKHTLIGTIDFTKVRDTELAVLEIIQKFPGKIESFYNVQPKEDGEETIEEIAKNRKILKKHAEPDNQRAARMILKDWQEGKIR